VHYLTDVLGGVALGVAVWAAVAVVALLGRDSAPS
jgi:membrane-associated phospholipid phosphatase